MSLVTKKSNTNQENAGCGDDFRWTSLRLCTLMRQYNRLLGLQRCSCTCTSPFLLPAVKSCFLPSTASSYSLVTQFSLINLGRSNPGEGEGTIWEFSLPPSQALGQTIVNSLSKTTSKFLHIFNLWTILNQKSPDALYQSPHTKKSHWHFYETTETSS